MSEGGPVAVGLKEAVCGPREARRRPPHLTPLPCPQSPIPQSAVVGWRRLAPDRCASAVADAAAHD